MASLRALYAVLGRLFPNPKGVEGTSPAGVQGGGAPLLLLKVKRTFSPYFFSPKFGGLWGLKERIPKGAQAAKAASFSFNKRKRTRTRNTLDISVRTDVSQLNLPFQGIGGDQK